MEDEAPDISIMLINLLVSASLLNICKNIGF